MSDPTRNNPSVWIQVHMKGTILHQLLHLLLLLLLYPLIPDHHATVGNCDSVSRMSTATWEPAAVQVYDESEDFSIALTLDMNRVSKTGLDIIGADALHGQFIGY